MSMLRRMGELARVDLDLLPREPRYRPLTKAAWYGRRLPVGLGIGTLAGVASVAIHPMAMWATLVGVFGYSIARRRKIASAARANMDGLAMLMAGELVSAAEAFERLCEESRGSPSLHSLTVCNRAAVFLESGEPERAAGLLWAALHAGWIGPQGTLSPYYPSVAGRLAMAEALRGRLDEAQSWRARAHAATSVAKHGMHLLTDVVVEARAGNDENVLSLVSQGWERAENLHSARQLRQVRLVEAFALERLRAGEYRGVSRETDSVRAVEAARSSTPGQFVVLTRPWDAVARFAERHGIR
ncbi:MAG: hypothetical protein KUG77_08920 [Nannocystaceae bacterium]|nr:hypothetical protein [Nannocystaceae bacterium]